MGASVEVEVPIRATNKRPDFVANFPDGVITVEATVPQLNKDIRRQIAENEEMVRIIESIAPPNWNVFVWRLPRLGPNESKKRFKRRLQEIFTQLPAIPSSAQEPIEVELDYGEVSLTLNPGRRNRAGVRGMASGADDTEQKIRAIVSRKKKQLRKATTPVVLAVSTSPFGEREDYDRALFGLTFERVNHEGRTIATGFDPVGVFGSKRPEPPTYAAVLAFTSVGFPGVADPILYIHPRFDGLLPKLLTRLERRTYRDGVGVEVSSATINNVTEPLGFVPRKP